MSRPNWLTEAIAAFGQPEIDFSGPALIGDGVTTSGWVWFVSGQNYHAGFTLTRSGRYEVVVGGPSRTAVLYLEAEPTDDDMRSVCAAVWPALRAGDGR